MTPQERRSNLDRMMGLQRNPIGRMNIQRQMTALDAALASPDPLDEYSKSIGESFLDAIMGGDTRKQKYAMDAGMSGEFYDPPIDPAFMGMDTVTSALVPRVSAALGKQALKQAPSALDDLYRGMSGDLVGFEPAMYMKPKTKGGFTSATMDAPFLDRTMTWIQPARAHSEEAGLVNLKKLDELWQKDPNFHVGSGGANQISNRYQKLMESYKTTPDMNMPELGFTDKGIPSFTDGRHRTAAARDLGVEAIPMSMTEKDMAMARKLGILQEETDNLPEVFKRQSGLPDDMIKPMPDDYIPDMLRPQSGLGEDPVDWYHGTWRDKFSRFKDPEGVAGHFTKDPSVAGEYGDKMMRTNLDIKNPVTIMDEDWRMLRDKPNMIERLKKQGHDAAISDDTGDIIPFYPDSIKQLEWLTAGGDPMDMSMTGRRISTRFPTAMKATEDPLKQMLNVGDESMFMDMDALKKNTGLMAQYPNFNARLRNPVRRMEDYSTHMERNLDFLHDKFPAELRDRASQWYDGANKLAGEAAMRHNIPVEASSAVYAALSPQKDWFMNVSLGDRVMQIYKDMPRWDSTMAQAMKGFAGKFNEPNAKKALQNIAGKDFADLDDPIDKAVWIRMFDESHNDRRYRIVTPEGEFGGFKASDKTGKEGVAQWDPLVRSRTPSR